MENHVELFENVLTANREYVALLDCDSSAEDQNKALAKCLDAFRLVIAANLCTEYKDYCDAKVAKTGSVF